MIDYDPEPALLVCHGPNGRRWFKRGPAIPDRWFPRDETDSDSDALDVLHGTKDRTRRSLIGAASWFVRRDDRKSCVVGKSLHGRVETDGLINPHKKK